MSVKLMAAVFSAHFPDIEYVIERKSKATGAITPKKIKVLAATAKWVTIALADHANDEGEGAYPSLDTLAAKTDLSRVTVIAALKGLQSAQIIAYVGLSKRKTSNYTISMSTLSGMNTLAHDRSTSKVALPPENITGKAALPPTVKPLYPTGKAALPEPYLTVLKPSNDAKTASPRQTQRKGDILDGILAFGAEGQKVGEMADRINEYPPDVQSTLKALVDLWGWPVVPARPAKSGRGGDFALWINDLREINSLISGHGTDALKAAHSRWAESKFTVAHPGALTRTIFAAVADLNQKSKKADRSATYYETKGPAFNIRPDGTVAPVIRPTRESLGLTNGQVRS